MSAYKATKNDRIAALEEQVRVLSAEVEQLKLLRAAQPRIPSQCSACDGAMVVGEWHQCQSKEAALQRQQVAVQRQWGVWSPAEEAAIMSSLSRGSDA